MKGALPTDILHPPNRPAKGIEFLEAKRIAREEEVQKLHENALLRPDIDNEARRQMEEYDYKYGDHQDHNDVKQSKNEELIDKLTHPNIKNELQQELNNKIMHEEDGAEHKDDNEQKLKFKDEEQNAIHNNIMQGEDEGEGHQQRLQNKRDEIKNKIHNSKISKNINAAPEIHVIPEKQPDDHPGMLQSSFIRVHYHQLY